MPHPGPGAATEETSVLYAEYARVRARHRVLRTPEGIWMVTRYADAASLLTDPRLAHWRMPLDGTPFAAAMDRWLRAIEPGADGGLRRAIRACADPERLGDAVRDAAADTEALLRARRSIDLIDDLARPFTLRVAASLLGVPRGARARFLDAVLAVGPHLFAAVGASGPLHEVLLEERSEGDGWIAAARDLEDDDFVAFSIFLLFAAHENMMNFIGNAWLALAGEDGAMGRLRRHPELWSGAIDELLRWDSPVQFVSALARESIEVGEETIAPGSTVWIALGSANRDGERFPDPDRLLLERRDNAHLSFGLGAMRCIGAGLAKLEARAALGLAVRLDGARLDEAPRWRRGSPVLRGPASIRVSYDGLSPERT